MRLNFIKNVDCFSYLKEIPKNFVDLIVIDPPYNELPKKWDNFNSWDLLNQEFDRILKSNGQLYIFGKQPMLSNVYNTLNKFFEFRFELIWNKGKGLWTSNFSPMRSHELVWCFKKVKTKISDIYFNINEIKTPGEPYVRKNKAVSTIRNNWDANRTISNKDGRRFPKSVLNFPSVIRRNMPRYIKHPTEKPESILEWIIKSSSKKNSIVLDCFLGSGTTVAVAKRLKRNYLGCEIIKKYFNYSQNRLGLIK